MKKINNFDSIKESTGFKRLPIGGYIAKILNVEDVPDKQYLLISYDIADGEQKGFYKREYDEDTREPKRWPSAGTFVRSYKDTALSMFKGFTNAIESSNKGYSWNFDESTLKGKLVGIVVGEEEYMSNKGVVRVKSKVKGVHSVQTIKSGDFTVPPLKKLDGGTTVNTARNEDVAAMFGDSGATVTETVIEKPNNIYGEDDLPF